MQLEEAKAASKAASKAMHTKSVQLNDRKT